jgi:hypothetical protein
MNFSASSWDGWAELIILQYLQYFCIQYCINALWLSSCCFVIVLDDLSDELENESINSSMGYFLSLQASLLATNYFSPSSTDFFSFS